MQHPVSDAEGISLISAAVSALAIVRASLGEDLTRYELSDFSQRISDKLAETAVHLTNMDVGQVSAALKTSTLISSPAINFEHSPPEAPSVRARASGAHETNAVLFRSIKTALNGKKSRCLGRVAAKSRSRAKASG